MRNRNLYPWGLEGQLQVLVTPLKYPSKMRGHGLETDLTRTVFHLMFKIFKAIFREAQKVITGNPLDQVQLKTHLGVGNILRTCSPMFSRELRISWKNRATGILHLGGVNPLLITNMGQHQIRAIQGVAMGPLFRVSNLLALPQGIVRVRQETMHKLQGQISAHL